MSTKVRWGVIGSGGIARRRTIPEGIIPAKNAELVAVFGIDSKVNNEVARQFKSQASASLDDLLAAEIDAVYVATPANGHYEQVLRCAQARKHVLCEKPLGLTVEESREMIAACKRRRCAVGLRLHDAFSIAKSKGVEVHSGREAWPSGVRPRPAFVLVPADGRRLAAGPRPGWRWLAD